MKDEPLALNLNCTCPFSWSLRSSFENTAKLQSFLLNLMWWIWSVFKQVWGCVWPCSHRPYISSISQTGRYVCVVKIIDLWNHSPHALLIWCWTACEVHRHDTHLSLTAEMCVGTITVCLCCYLRLSRTKKEHLEQLTWLFLIWFPVCPGMFFHTFLLKQMVQNRPFSQQTFLSCHSSKSTGVANYNNDDCITLVCLNKLYKRSQQAHYQGDESGM